MRFGFIRMSMALTVVAGVPSLARAQAQMPTVDSLRSGPPRFVGEPGQASKPQPPPPPALPGATPRAATTAPATHPPLDMEPNEALFDAINRGDIAAARDAISRGADLNGRNILGMSPLELSVDLGRNDISFLLLSLRNADTGGNRPPPAQLAAKPPVTKQAKQTRQAKQTKPASAQRAAVSEREPAHAQTARLFSGDGGTPIPNAGFLGFDPSRR